MRTRNRYLGCIVVLLALTNMAEGAKTLYVSNDGNNSWAGTSWDTAVKSFATALGKAATDDGDVVLVSNGTFSAWNNGGTDVYSATNLIYAAKGVTLKSLRGRDETILDCGGINKNRAVCLNHANAVLDGFTITNGNGGASGEGGGVYVVKALLVTNCVIANCIGYRGGGMSDYGLTRAVNCVFRRNTAINYGGAFYSESLLPLVLSNCAFEGNAGPSFGTCSLPNGGRVYDCVFSNNGTGGNGGGIYTGGSYTGVVERCWFVTNRANDGGGMYLTGFGRARDCDFVGNVATSTAGGVYVASTNTVVMDSRIVGNSGYDAGGASCNGMLSNCVVSSNTASRYGGGVYVKRDGSAGGWIYNCTIIGNTALSAGVTPSGGGIYMIYGGEARNCLVARNVGANKGGGIFVSWLGSGRTSTVHSCTIVSNFSATGTGDGINVDTPLNLFFNCVIYSNGAADVASSGGSVANTNYFFNCCALTGTKLSTANGNITNNPQFAGFAGGNFRLIKGSLCINTGSNQGWMAGTKDLDNRPRLDRFSVRVDMGAYEFVPSGVIFAGY